jgi:hypothetical protein
MVRTIVKFPQSISFRIGLKGKAHMISLKDIMDSRSSDSDLEIKIVDDIGKQTESKFIKRKTLEMVSAIQWEIKNDG